MISVPNSVKVLIAFLAFSSVIEAQVSTSQPFNGITYKHEVRSDPPLRLHIVQIDLSAPGIELYVSRGGIPDCGGGWTTVLQTVRMMAQRDHLDVAVNGNYFGARDRHEFLGQTNKYPLGSPAFAIGAAMTDGKLWSQPDKIHPSLVVEENGKVEIGYFPKLPAKAKQVVSGSYLLMTKGEVSDDHPDQSPRTAVGIDKQGKTLTLLVVDGRRPDYSVGLDGHDMATEMQRLGCWTALNLDGGGSSTLVMRHPQSDQWRVINRPSDGHQLPIPLSVERPVACALGVRAKG